MQTLFELREGRWERVRSWMRGHRVAGAILIAAATLLLAGLAGYHTAQEAQAPDPDFDARVAHPAYVTEHPRVLLDEAHWNFHTAEWRYKPLADLLRNDGYEVVPNHSRFTRESLRGARVLVIANGLGGKGVTAMLLNAIGYHRAIFWDLGATFTPAECDAVAAWVRDGGSLLLVSDHRPAGSAAQPLARRFGVDMSNAYTEDIPHHDPDSDNWNFIIYSREEGTLLAHPVTEGRGPEERVSRVMTFTGQSLSGPPGSIPFLLLSPTAEDYPSLWSKKGEGTAAAGRAQGLAFSFGQGRVVVLGEAAMLSAQVVRGAGREYRFGMEHPGYDDRQLALNILHWLSGLLD